MHMRKGMKYVQPLLEVILNDSVTSERINYMMKRKVNQGEMQTEMQDFLIALW